MMAGSILRKLEHGTLGEKASAALLGFIRAENLQPGSMLPAEARLSELLGVSRPVIREALRVLQGLGVVAVLNGKGAIVRELNSSTLEVYFAHALQTVHNSTSDLMEVRKGVEIQTAILAAERHSAEQAKQMLALVDRMRSIPDKAEPYSKLDIQLHLLIAEGSGNALLLQIVRSIRTAMEDLSLRGMRRRSGSESLAEVQNLHEQIVEKIIARDGARAGELMGLHMDAALKVLVSS